jgi:hypothetical protein
MAVEMVPLSANIFHAKGDLQARAVAALEIASACLAKMQFGQFIDPRDAHAVIDVRAAIKGLHDILAPGHFYECSGELLAALNGDATELSPAPESAKGPSFAAWNEAGDFVGVFSSSEKVDALGEPVITKEIEIDKPLK